MPSLLEGERQASLSPYTGFDHARRAKHRCPQRGSKGVGVGGCGTLPVGTQSVRPRDLDRELDRPAEEAPVLLQQALHLWHRHFRNFPFHRRLLHVRLWEARSHFREFFEERVQR